jgi:hypothetical protein
MWQTVCIRGQTRGHFYMCQIKTVLMTKLTEMTNILMTNCGNVRDQIKIF